MRCSDPGPPMPHSTEPTATRFPTLVGAGYARRLKHALDCSACLQGTTMGDDQPVLPVPADL
jgi:hypothetical protein